MLYKDEKIIREERCVEGIRSGDEDAFKEVFLQYFVPLSSLAADFVGSYDLGREIVQEVFLHIWERRVNWSPNGPLKPYLYQAVCNRAINHIKREKSRREAMERYYDDMISIAESGAENENDLREMTRAIWKVVNKLPRRRYLVFVMHKLHGLSYREIAFSMDISVKTVENQMGRALKFLREEMKSKSKNCFD